LHTDLIDFIKSGKDAKEAQVDNLTKKNKPKPKAK
jgi:hypothetical protein